MTTIPDSALRDALATLLPTAGQTRLLRACLQEGDTGRVARRAWRAAVRDPLRELAGSGRGGRVLLPLLYWALRHDSEEMDKALLTVVRTAFAREEIRSTAVLRICQLALGCLAAESIPVILARGVALAATAYDAPALRHCHDVDVLVSRDDMPRAVEALVRNGEFQVRRAAGTTSGASVVHPSGLPIVLHDRPYRFERSNQHLESLWPRAVVTTVGETQAHLLAPEDGLLHVLGHAAFASSRASLLWVCDAWQILRRHPDLDWDLLNSQAIDRHLALPLAILLRYLADELGAAVPAATIERLSTRVPDAFEVELAMFGALVGLGGDPWRLTRRAGSWAGRLRLTAWMIAPSTRYLREVERVPPDRWLAPYYLVRPLLAIALRGVLAWRGVAIHR